MKYWLIYKIKIKIKIKRRCNFYLKDYHLALGLASFFGAGLLSAFFGSAFLGSAFLV